MPKKPNGAAPHDDEETLTLDPAAAGADETEVILADDLSAGEDAPPTPEPPTREVAPQEGIEELKSKLAASEAARLAERKRAQDAEARVGAKDKEVHESNLALVTNAIDGLRSEQASNKSAYAQALRDQDYDRAAEIQEKMGDNSAKLQVLENGKTQLEIQARETPRRAETQPDDPVEALAVQLSPRSAAWVRSHPDYARNPVLTQKMLAAHNLAVADGLAPDTDDYFANIEDTLKINRAPAAQPRPEETEVALSEAAAPQSRRTAPPAAPPSRGGSGGTPSDNPRTVRLTRDQLEMAEMMGMSPAEYAKNMVALKAEGKLN